MKPKKKIVQQGVIENILTFLLLHSFERDLILLCENKDALCYRPVLYSWHIVNKIQLLHYHLFHYCEIIYVCEGLIFFIISRV